MLKKIDNLGRVVVPIPFRKEIGVELNEYVDMVVQDNTIIIKKMDKMLSKEAIKHFYKNFEKGKSDSDYDKGFSDALKFVLGEEVKNEI